MVSGSLWVDLLQFVVFNHTIIIITINRKSKRRRDVCQVMFIRELEDGRSN